MGLEELNLTATAITCTALCMGIYMGNRANLLREKAQNIINGGYARFLVTASERGSRFLHRFYFLGEPSEFIKEHAEIRD